MIQYNSIKKIYCWQLFVLLSILILTCGREPIIIVSDTVEKVSLNKDIAASYCSTDGIIYAGDVSSGTLYQSKDEGISWKTIYRFQNGEGPVRCVFASQKGTVFVSRDRTGELIRSDDHGQNFDVCLRLSDEAASVVWRMAENKQGWLFAAEYSNKCLDDSCAYIYRSKDDGINWHIVYDNPDKARHFHFVAVDPFTNYLYAAQGDGIEHASLIRSTDGGDSWITLGHDSLNSKIHWQFTSIAFTPEYRIFGEDEPEQSDIVRTSDDVNFEKVFVPQGLEKYNFWAWGRVDSRGNILFGSWTQHNSVPKQKPEKGRSVVYISYDEGTTWTRIVDFGAHKNHAGTHYASNVTNDDWIYCHSSGSDKGFKLRIR
jgi:photosystem II stability/assembly factor-like uncharacterized protein